jgi:hypothetical protein
MRMPVLKFSPSLLLSVMTWCSLVVLPSTPALESHSSITPIQVASTGGKAASAPNLLFGRMSVSCGLRGGGQRKEKGPRMRMMRSGERKKKRDWRVETDAGDDFDREMKMGESIARARDRVRCRIHTYTYTRRNKQINTFTQNTHSYNQVPIHTHSASLPPSLPPSLHRSIHPSIHPSIDPLSSPGSS